MAQIHGHRIREGAYLDRISTKAAMRFLGARKDGLRPETGIRLYKMLARPILDCGSQILGYSAKAESVSSKNSRSWGQQTGILDGVPGAVHGIWNSYCAAFRRDFERYFHLKFIVHDIATRVLKRRISIISDISVRKDSPIVITTFLNAAILKPIECIF